MFTVKNSVFLGALLAVGAWSTANAANVARQSATTAVTFCAEANYDPGETCDNESIPSFGTGCATLDLEPGACYNWNSFPNDDISLLINNVSFVFIPCCTEAISSCNLYTSDDCTGTSGFAGAGETGLDCQQPAFNDKVNSFLCDARL